MVSLKQGIKISAIIDKLDVKIDFKELMDENGDISQDLAGAELLIQILKKAHTVENELYELVADIKKCSIAEAQDVDLAELVKEKFSDSNFATFFKSAVRSKLQG